MEKELGSCLFFLFEQKRPTWSLWKFRRNQQRRHVPVLACPDSILHSFWIATAMANTSMKPTTVSDIWIFSQAEETSFEVLGAQKPSSDIVSWFLNGKRTGSHFWTPESLPLLSFSFVCMKHLMLLHVQERKQVQLVFPRNCWFQDAYTRLFNNLQKFCGKEQRRPVCSVCTVLQSFVVIVGWAGLPTLTLSENKHINKSVIALTLISDMGVCQAEKQTSEVLGAKQSSSGTVSW